MPKRRRNLEEYNNLKQKKKIRIEENENEVLQTKEFSPESSFLIFEGLRVYLLSTGFGKARYNLFKAQLIKYGAECSQEFFPQFNSHVIIEDNLTTDRVCKLLTLTDTSFRKTNIKIVKSLWLSRCLRYKQLVNTEEYELKLNAQKDTFDTENMVFTTDEIAKSLDDIKKEETSVVHILDSKKNSRIVKDGDSEESDYVPSDKESAYESAASSCVTPLTSPEKNANFRNKFVCFRASSEAPINYNKHITDKLEVLAVSYKNTKDQWRAYSYEKAISTLKNHPNEIISWEEAIKIRGIGEGLADKIAEIIESGSLRKLTEFCSAEHVSSVNLFTQIWGAGPTTAELWYQQGFRTLDDVQNKANLTRQQKIGLAHFHDFLERMPRSEAAEIETMIKESALKIQKGLIVTACGSYRRGKPTCGDVDVLITHPDGKSHIGIFSKILNYLKDIGFLTDTLVFCENIGNQKKYLGVCKLPGQDRKHRRLDIIVVPYREYACALMYFTGSAHFNRSMRLLAQKLGMSLSEHSLNAGVIRKGKDKIRDGLPLPTPTEESIFQLLSLSYRRPEERDH